MENRKMAEFILEMLHFWGDWDCSNTECEDCIFGENKHEVCDYLDKARWILDSNLNDD